MILKNCSLKQFERAMQNKNIICFGAGNCLRHFIAQCDIKNRIRFIIDNNETLWDTFINLDGQNIKILSLDNDTNEVCEKKNVQKGNINSTTLNKKRNRSNSRSNQNHNNINYY